MRSEELLRVEQFLQELVLLQHDQARRGNMLKTLTLAFVIPDL